jgi:hypothetical protein
VTVWTGESLTSKRALELETMVSLYGVSLSYLLHFAHSF